MVARRSNDGYLVLAGQFAFDEIRDGLHDRVYDDDEFRGYEIWSSGGLTPVATTVALIEDEGLLVMGKEDSVLTILRNLSTERAEAKDGDMVRAMRRAGDGWHVVGVNSCAPEMRGCEAIGIALSSGERYQVEFRVALLFRTGRSAESERDDVEDLFDSERVLALDSVRTSDEFVEVVGSVDEDDLPSLVDFIEDRVAE